MFQPSLIIISYSALLLLLMPVTVVGMVLTAVTLSLGIGLMVHKKVYKAACWKSKRYSLIAPVLLLVTDLGLIFYDRWLPASTQTTVLHIPGETLLLIGSLMLSVLSLYFVYAGLQLITKKLSDIAKKSNFTTDLICCLAAAVTVVILAQVMVDTRIFSMGPVKFLWGVLIVAVVILLLYCLFGRVMPSVCIGAGLFMVISTINAYVYRFRERTFEPVDIFSAGTAMNVAANYSLFPVPLGLLIGWGIFIAMLILLSGMQHKTGSALTAKRRLSLLTVGAVSSVAIFFYASGLSTYHWHNEGALFNGYILDFVSKFKEITAPRPDNYSIEQIEDLADKYALDGDAQESEPSKHPHIIVIMDEAFSDLRVAGDFSTNTEVLPFISSLKEDTISGYALSSVYGGNTANSEYEFLTGNSLAWLSPNVVPYQQYIRSSTYSMVSYLKSSYHYKCVAMHPFQASGWNRPDAYKHLGFDERYFEEDFPQRNYVRGYVSDREMFEFLIDTYEAQKDEPLFIFGVTMQNHGGYTYVGENFTSTISLTGAGSGSAEVEQYLSLIHETDKAVQILIEYFQNVDEEVLIVFFGDHQPKIDDSFYEAISASAADTLDERQKRYMVPFFIWANYDLEEKQIECTSLNYLSSYVYDAARIALPPYAQFLREMEATIPAINANGFYSADAGCYLTFDKANDEERRWLETYEMLQYNALFDKKDRNETFFPALE